MKYTIEIVRYNDDGTRNVLHRFASNAISPTLVKAKAATLLRRAPNANGFRISTHRGHEIYNWRKD
jgi:hypothetical protein